jgi:hypothetical protein
MHLRKIGWLGTKTEKGKEMAELFGGVLGIPFHHRENGPWVFQLADGSKVEVFGSKSHNPHFTTRPVPRFLTDDVDAATEELRAVGIPIVFRTDPVGRRGRCGMGSLPGP